MVEPLLSVPVPKVVAPSLNVMVPVGVPPLAAVTAAVNVTLCPYVDGFNDEDKATVTGGATTPKPNLTLYRRCYSLSTRGQSHNLCHTDCQTNRSTTCPLETCRQLPLQ